tara:strand:+ start:518 stop:793 length:276 start_codon:yes stop_codon:yes gene_type:complete
VHISSEVFVMSTGNKTLRGGRESDDEADMMMMTTMITVMPLLSRRSSGGLALSTVVVVVFLFCASIGTNADSMLDVFFQDFLFSKTFCLGF